MSANRHDISSKKDVRDEAIVLGRLGFERAGRDSEGHVEFEHPSAPGTVVRLPNTPKSPGWRNNVRQRAAKILGVSQWQLERMIAGQPLTKSARDAGPGRTLPEQVVIDHAEALGVELDLVRARRLLTRFDGVKGARRALDQMAAAKRKAAA